jgi:hypothetical protein
LIWFVGAIQALEAKERLNIEMYGLYDPEKGAWIEINEPLTNYGFVNGVRTPRKQSFDS